ncbi:MAG: homocysteine S-methyltransferase family protein [Planctomycetota bacterium]
MTSFADAVARGLHLFDGATGTQLLVSGFDAERDLLGAGPEALSTTRAEQVRAVHESYLDAGCEWIRTNTFQASPSELAAHGLGKRFEAIVRGAVLAAREAVDAWRDDVPGGLVLGSIGPGPAGVEAKERARDAAELARALVAAGVDGIALETQTRLDVAAASFDAIAGLGRSAFVSFAPGADGRLADGATLADVATWARELRPALLGLNCGTGPDATERDLAALRANWDGPLAALPTAGVPQRADDLTSFPVAPHEFGERVAAWVRRFELAAVGGCCGTGPRHLAALGEALGRPRPWADLGEPRADEFDEDEEGA